jgi:hypothetical protein
MTASADGVKRATRRLGISTRRNADGVRRRIKPNVNLIALLHKALLHRHQAERKPDFRLSLAAFLADRHDQIGHWKKACPVPGPFTMRCHDKRH